MRAIAIAVTATTVALGAAACGDDGDGVQTVPPTVSSTIPDEAGGSASGPDGGDVATCSASELRGPTFGEQDLPTEVAVVRRAIHDAAAGCDYDQLESIAETGEPEFTFGSGTGQGSFAELLEAAEADDSGVRPTEAILLLLNTAHGQVEADDGETIYVWPAAAAVESWSEVRAVERDAIVPPYTAEDLQAFDEAGTYTGYRLGIDQDGDWRWFVSGA